MRKHLAKITTMAVLLLSLCCAGLSSALTVGVEKGDWIEYNVAFTGDASFGHDVTWARMEITNVQGTSLTLKITTKSTDGSIETEPLFTIEFGTGQLGDDFVIPANLNVGDKFYDRAQGNITIESSQQKNLLGAKRTTIMASTNFTAYTWDSSTGVLVEANSSYPNYSIVSKINSTNMWPEQILGINTEALYAVSAAAIVFLAVTVTLIVLTKRKRK